jgi:hypothetical protein
VPRSYSISTREKLCFASGNSCAFPACRNTIYDFKHGVKIGQIAHIEAVEKRGPRFNENQTPQERRSFGNLMLMCPNHHTLIDKDTKTYTVEKLKKLKQEHEEKQQGKITPELSSIMAATLFEDVKIRDIGEEIASRMQPGTIEFNEQDFGRALERYKSCTTIRVKGEILRSEIEHAMSTIPTDRKKWNRKVKQIANRILQIGLREILDKVYIEHWLSNLSHIITYSDKETRTLYVKKLKKYIMELLGKERPTVHLIEIVQQVNNYSTTIVEKLVEDSLNRWSHEEFDSIVTHIDFKRTWRLNQQFMNDLQDKLLAYRNAENEENHEKLYRLKRLDELIKVTRDKDIPISFL